MTPSEENAWNWMWEAFRSAEHTIVVGLIGLLGTGMVTLRGLFLRLAKVESKVEGLEYDIVSRLDRVESRQDRMLELLARIEIR